MKNILILLALFVGCSTTSNKKFNTEVQNPPPQTNFSEIDTNEDGVITVEEFDIAKQNKVDLKTPLIWFSIILCMVFISIYFFGKNKNSSVNKK